MTWRNGRTLASIGNTSFTYDGEGQRVSKTTGNVITEYIYEGDKLVMQKQGNTSLFFLYDTSGIFGFDHIVNGNTTGTYYYRTDGKGEIIGLTDSAGNIVANYTYDAWGNPTAVTDANGNAVTSSTHIGILNPIRYKGYCYDTETGLYYLNSRYYDPAVCRFVNADDVELLGVNKDFTSFNLFTYCTNNPVINKDSSGYAVEIIWDIISLGSSVIDVVANPANPWAWIGLAGDVIDVVIPFVGGTGEAVKLLRVTIKNSDKIDEVVDVGKALKRDRSRAVAQAWKNELDNINSGGRGISRTWEPDEIEELLKTGKVSGYEGHHMWSVKGYPQLAGNPRNIQFLTHAEHLAAHSGNWRIITHGPYIN